MSKVFRLHQDNNTLIDWQQSQPYSTNVINQINDPNGATAKNEITSIPSPFARIDLVKNAFKEVNKIGLDGNTIYHKMVSDSLDIGQIFFNYPKFKNLVNIVFWDKTNDLQALRQSQIPSHKTVADTLEMYMLQDGTTYNFNNMQRIYMLQYIGPQCKINDIIGATSPCTLFFSSANDLSKRISNYISFDGNDKPFDNQYQPLYKRDVEYIKYLCALKASYPNFAIEFSEVSEYITLTINKLGEDVNNQGLINQISRFDANTINDYTKLVVNNNNVDVINGITLCEVPAVQINSDFEINSKVFVGDKKPLVLPVEKGNQYSALTYTSTVWNPNNSAPYFDSNPWEKRTLPSTSDSHPYLTISDFLEDNIVKMPYRMNDKDYYDGGFNAISTGNESYLLPLKKLFFDFFTVDELLGTLPNGQKMFEFRSNAGGITVVLRVPVQKNYCIEYKRIYLNNNIADISNNLGGIIVKKFGLGVLPPVKADKDYAYYRIALFDDGDNDVYLNPCLGNNVVTAVRVVHTPKSNRTTGIVSYVIEKNLFDRIEVVVGSNSGVLIPKLKDVIGNSQFSFAIDFGTTNTHIEYSKDSTPSQVFDITVNDKQVSRLHNNYGVDVNIEGAYDRYLVPSIIDNVEYAYPMRTVFAECNTISYDKPVHSMAHAHIPFKYEKEVCSKYYSIKTNLKWSNEERRRVELYIENIVILLRNKVLLNNGSLAKTQIRWFYPTSMVQYQISGLKKIWCDLYKKYFGDDIQNVVAIPESIAPYKHYKTTQGAQTNVLTIDIGGETSDIFVVEDSEYKMMSSFRFASNAIFGDAFGYNSDNNGFVSRYLDRFKGVLNVNGLNDLLKALDDIVIQKKSPDIIAFFYALSNNKDVKKNNITALDFQDILSSDDCMKYVFVMFYASLLYFTAKEMKLKGLKKPLTIAFSGNGSKSIKVLSEDVDVLKKFAKMIFEDVYGTEYAKGEVLDVICEKNPKTATCKGGILTGNNDIDIDFDSLKFNLLGVSGSETIDNFCYNDVTDNVINKVVNHVQEMIDYILSPEMIDFYVKNFGVNQGKSNGIKDLCNIKLEQFAKSALDARKEELKTWKADDSCKLEETLFFYPVIGMLNNLAREMAK
ncbi:MAG: hypothetical protein IJZ87_06635 [Bacteroidales bacterium]|nr:hypothetical protein [Bacteroidales bacterium]